MDQIKVGEFISTIRKEKQLTQKDLAEQLGVSDKTISRWETGKGLPDISTMLPLCELLDISINELVSGQKLPLDEYSQKAEENIMTLLEENQNNKEKGKFQIILGFFILALSIIFVYISSFGISLANLGNYIDMPSILMIGLAELSIIFISWNKTKKEKVQLMKELAIPFSVLFTIIAVIGILPMDFPSEVLLVNLAVAIIPILYGVTLHIILSIMESLIIE